VIITDVGTLVVNQYVLIYTGDGGKTIYGTVGTTGTGAITAVGTDVGKTVNGTITMPGTPGTVIIYVVGTLTGTHVV